MSVFSDFQRLWTQRFPQSSLSDQWEQDVRKSLENHKQKINELRKEIEQETLYVEYLERLLSDVEKYKESGGDPTTLFEAPTTSLQQHQGPGNGTENQDGILMTNNEDNKHNEDNVLMRSKTSDNLKASSSDRQQRDSNKYASYNPLNGSDSLGHHSNDSNDDHEDKDIGTEKDYKNIQIQKNGALNQCINELTSTFKRDSTTKNNKVTNATSEVTNLSQQITSTTNNTSSSMTTSSSNDSQKICDSSTIISGTTSATTTTTTSSSSLSTSSSSSSSATLTANVDNQTISNDKPSHFVTVIEVKESKTTPVKNIIGNNNNNTTSTTDLISGTSTTQITTTNNCNSNGNNIIEQRRHSSESEAILTSTNNINNNNNNNNNNNIGSNKTKVEPTAPPMSPAMSISTSGVLQSVSSTTNTASSTSSVSSFSGGGSNSGGGNISNISSSASAAVSDAKKKVPPRPPPKFMKRVEPPTVPGSAGIGPSSPKRATDTSGSGSSNESPSSSLERNIKPSDILRQKSDSLDAKALSANRRTTPELGRFTKSSDLAEEFGRKVNKSESLEKKKSTTTSANITGSDSANATSMKINQSPTGSLGKAGGATGINETITVKASPTNSLSKFANARHNIDSPTGSLEKSGSGSGSGGKKLDIGSKESLASQGNISEIIKSYESISSISSDGACNKTGQHNNENEPYYDTVPMDNGEGEYVYIKPGGNGSTSSRDDLSTAGSTLPMPANPRTSNSHQQQQQQQQERSQQHQLQQQTGVIEPESPGRNSNYVNIDYFLHQSNETRSSSIDSDGELDAPPLMRTISHDEQTSQTPGALRKISGNLRGTKIRSILNSIIQSETIYVQCLNKMIQYKKAIHATLGTSQPVIKEEEENTIFFKIEEIHSAHMEFLNDLKQKLNQTTEVGGDILVGDAFKRLSDHIDLYSAFLHNYGQAIDTVKKCCANNPQFKEISSKIALNLQNEQSLPLEDLLHKPVARVQINSLLFNDILNETPPTHPDHQQLRQAQKTIHVFLKQFNVVNQRLPTESNKNLRRMVKNSFIVELVDGHRKLRHLFLFNDVIACAKYKAAGRERFEFELKWYIPLKDVVIYDEETNTDNLKESSPANILQLKSQACNVRDQILLEEKDEKKMKLNGLRSGDKHRRKLADLEAQLVLASPNLVFRIGNKAANKTMTFFLSSDFERTQWIEQIINLQQSCNMPGVNTINALEIQAFVLATQSRIKPDMGSYLMRNRNDESLLVGDLHITVQGLTGLEQPADMYICLEVDSYGHYFRKAKTKMVCRSTSPLWNESFVLELEGSQNVRILLYEAQEHRPALKAKNILKLSRNWLTEAPQNKTIKMSDIIVLNTNIRFVPGEVTLRRVPTSKPGALFGAKLDQVRKREKRDIPFIISACIREVERRGMAEVGIYRVSGSVSDLARLKKLFETNAYEAEQLLKEVDIHSVTGILKSYLRELPEALFTDLLYPKLFETFNQYSGGSDAVRMQALMGVFEQLPQANKASILHILDHLIRVHQQEGENKMSLHNLAMVFGPTLLRPGQTQTKQKDLLASSTVDVMAQAGILYSFLQARLKKD
ncbi:serine-rich adhesin for platelets isoform X2 [Condylostylus longicornis]|uniref:serine-rich adhesin for platelets isoform X2 n=1 Tax=Condylostylus longicornis TaxID=2530218 RepID=UPI00244DA0ED|nr:serine-rich adhesin for platelets isoform X2 [Condylostylus longicornis]